MTSWTAPDAKASLGQDEVHVWRASLDPPRELLARLAPVLSDDERAQAARFKLPGLAERFVASRAIQRNILSRYAGAQPSALRFRVSPHGKPSLEASSTHADLRFNVSNAGGIGLYAVARGRDVGVDVEAIRSMPRALAMAERFFSAVEVDTLRAAPPHLRDLTFLTCWTRKEAYVKAAGYGLSLALDSFDVVVALHHQAALLETRPDAAEAERWSMYELEPGPGYVGALVVEGRPNVLTCFEWSPAP